MAEKGQNLQKVFDLSQDAKAFKNRLWLQIKDYMDTAVQPLEDDDLIWVNAAGVPSPRSEDETFK